MIITDPPRPGTTPLGEYLKSLYRWLTDLARAVRALQEEMKKHGND